jgi:hypothetical protein
VAAAGRARSSGALDVDRGAAAGRARSSGALDVDRAAAGREPASSFLDVDRAAPAAPEALRDLSVDLPSPAPAPATFLDTGEASPSTDLELRAALANDFFGTGQEAPSGPSAGEPVAAPDPMGPSSSQEAPLGPGGSRGAAPSADDDDFLDGEALFARGGGRPLARLALARVDADAEDETRVARASGVPRRAAPPPSAARRGPLRWPTWTGLVLGLAVSATFVPGWAPAPLDGIAPWVAELVHPAARLRLPNALPDVRAEGAVAFPYQLNDRTVVVVRGEAVNVGDRARRGMRATVLMLDGDREIGRASAPVGVVPRPAELVRRLAAGGAPLDAAPGEDAVLEPGDRAPFLVVLPHVEDDAREWRFRVEFEAS